jgi:heat shock protein HslJ
MAQEQAYLQNFQAANQYTISGNSLTLTTAGGPLVYSAAQVSIQPVPAQ